MESFIFPLKSSHFLCHDKFETTEFFKYINFLNSIYLWRCWVFFAACELSLIVVHRVSPSLWGFIGFSLRWFLLLQSTGSCIRGSVLMTLVA